MIEFRLNHTALRWDFSFFAVLAVFFWLDSSRCGLTALAICSLHELGHLAVMRICGIVPESVTFYGAGIRISAPETESRSASVQAAVYSAGCIVNLMLALFLWKFPELRQAAAISLFTGLFNLLPVGEFDGRRLLGLLFIAHLKPENVDNALRLCGIISVLVCTAGVVFCCKGASFTFATTMIYLLIMSLRRV